MTHNKEELLTRYEKLPQAVKDAMFAEASADKIEELGRKYGLLIDKIGALADEVGYFMLGMTHPNDFKGQIIRSTGLSETKANEIIDELNKTIFLPIREHMSALHNVEESGVEMPDEQQHKPIPQRPVSFAQGGKRPDIVPPMIFPQGATTATEEKQRIEEKIPPAPEFIKTFASQQQDAAQALPQEKPITQTPPLAQTSPALAINVPPQPTTQAPPPKPAPQQIPKPNDPYHEQI